MVRTKISRVDEDQPVAGIDQVYANLLVSHVIQIVRNAKRFDPRNRRVTEKLHSALKILRAEIIVFL